MYTVSVRRDFTARHYLVGGDWGDENKPHSHDYRLELALGGAHLDRHGYLVDIVEIERHLDDVVARYRGALLNDLEEMEGINPSLERFCRVLSGTFSARIAEPRVSVLTVTLWENEQAWASHRLARGGDAG